MIVSRRKTVSLQDKLRSSTKNMKQLAVQMLLNFAPWHFQSYRVRNVCVDDQWLFYIWALMALVKPSSHFALKSFFNFFFVLFVCQQNLHRLKVTAGAGLMMVEWTCALLNKHNQQMHIIHGREHACDVYSWSIWWLTKRTFYSKGALPHETTSFKTAGSHIYKQHHAWTKINLHSLMNFMQKHAHFHWIVRRQHTKTLITGNFKHIFSRMHL